jgi:mono/diheme cytochrome c family protein
MTRLKRTAIVMALALLPLPVAAQGPRGGAALAERWCMACHNVEANPPRAVTNGTPSFAAIAARSETTPASLDGYLSTGHTRMPDFALSASEKNALITYILSLR